MQRSTATSCQSDSCSATQNTPRILCNSKPHYRIHSIPPLELWLSQFNPIHILAQSYFLKIHFKIIFPATSLFSLFFFFKFANRNYLYIFLLVHARCMPHPTRPHSLDLPIKCYLFFTWNMIFVGLRNAGDVNNTVISECLPYDAV
jgi:hypothetical protein